MSNTLRHCRPCNSQRKGHQCWKCGSVTQVVCEGWDYPRMPPVDEIRALAKSVGYALAVHGSLERDLDLIAVPWSKDAVQPEELIECLCEGLRARVVGSMEQKPLGRLAVNIQLNGWYKLIDLSITPIVHTP